MSLEILGLTKKPFKWKIKLFHWFDKYINLFHLKGVSKPFQDVIKANIGDAHAMGQKPVVFLRQVLGLVVNPDSMNDPSIPDDAKERAKAILDGCKVRKV